MNRINIKNRKHNFLLLAFLIPFIGMLLVMAFSQYKPFGKYSMLYSDMYHQYYPFFVAFRQALRSGDSLLYSWSVGLGMDYLGLISYYLASPLNLLSIIVPESWLLEYFSLLVPVKLGLASLFFAIFLKKSFGKDDLSIAIFGSFYGLCAWALGYQWNVMWLDTFALLPLVTLGMVSLLRDRKFVLYTLTLFLSVYSNYYIGFFTCIFVLLSFFCYEICRWQGVKRFFQDLCRIALFSVLAIGMTAVLELPAFAALQTTQSSVNAFPEGFKLNIADENTWMGLLDAMRQVAGNMSGGIEPTFKEGLPNVYCGVAAIVLAWLFLMAKEVKLRDKLCCVFLLLFFNVSFIIRQLDYIWHGFHFTNMIPYRFSFLYSFVMLYMAYRAWTLRRGFKLWQILIAAALTIGIFACSDSNSEWSFLAYNLGFLALYLIAGLWGRYQKRIPEDAPERQAQEIQAANHSRALMGRSALLFLMAAELIVDLVCFGIYFPGTAVSNYPKGTTYSASMIRYMKEREQNNLFYRAETTHSQTLNDGALNGYNGVSAFTSSANVKVTEFMKALGYGAKNTYNRYCYEEASPVSNLFLGLKYMINRDGKDKESTYFEEIHRYGEVSLLENNFYLPLGFLAEEELADVDFSGSNSVFRFQNELMTAASGVEGDVWKLMTNVPIEGVDVTVTNQNSSGYCSYEDGLSGSTVIYTYTVDMDGFMCVDLNLPKRNNISIWKNGVELYSESMSLQQMLAVGDVAVGDVVEVRATCKANESGTLTISAGILSQERFRQCYEVLSASTLELTTFRNTLVEGTITCDRDGYLYTSIPQNGNWQVEVDGEPAEILLTGDVMVGVLLTEGTHEIRFTYHNAAFSLGWKISLCCAVVFAVLAYAANQPKLQKGKYEKKKRPGSHE
ncbi:MAG: YfhO family protein [Oscillospiraceae bacterium]|nr:YfhO family protein [Oscillospiraceae bacterium]